jgi:GNAT superfamily N-acetyltransferase
MQIRRARPEEAHILTGIAMRSKGFWGYDDDFMEACRASLTVTEDKIRRHYVYIVTHGPENVGFYCLITNGETGVLDDLFVNPPYIGTGCGKLLWEDMMMLARDLGIREIAIDADPNAEGFYLRMSAERIGETESTAVRGRLLPLLRVKVV